MQEIIRTQTCDSAVHPVVDMNSHNAQDRPRRSLAAVWHYLYSLISTPQWHQRPCSAPSWFVRVDKKLPVKADLAIYSHILDMSG